MRVQKKESENGIGSVEADVDTSGKYSLGLAVSEAVPKDSLFHSTKVSYIRGDVTSQAHLTICYGVKNLDLPQRIKTSKIKIAPPGKTKITQIDYWFDQHGYYVIFAVPDISDEIFYFDKWIRNNNDVSSISLPFKPHITLCYLKDIPLQSVKSIINDLSSRLVDSTINLPTIHFLEPDTHEKTVLFRSFSSARK